MFGCSNCLMGYWGLLESEKPLRFTLKIEKPATKITRKLKAVECKRYQ